MKHYLIDLIVMFWLFAPAINAQDINWTTLTTSDGLKSNHITSIIEDRYGILWFGYEVDGVSRFDGQSWTTYNTLNSGLTNNVVTKILEDSQRVIWFGTDGSGVSCYDGQSWTTYNTSNSGLANDGVTEILEDSQRVIWFGTNGGGVSRYDGRSWTTFTIIDGLVSNSVRVILEDNQGALWFGTNQGVNRFDGQSWTKFTTSDNLVSNSVHSILEDSQGVMWFGTFDGVSRFDSQGWTTFEGPNFLASDYVTSILQDNRGNIWFGTRTRFGQEGGVSRYDGQDWIVFTKDDGLAGDDVEVILEDSRGAIWFGTDGGGVSRYYKDSWIIFTPPESLVGENVYALLEDRYGAIWFGTTDGVSLFDTYNWSSFTNANGLAGNYVIAIMEDSQGKLWFGTSYPGSGASCYDGQSWITYNTSNSGLVNNIVREILQDRNGTIWFGTNDGISLYDGHSWATIDSSNSELPSNIIDEMMEDSQGNIWLATSRSIGIENIEATGVSRYDGRSWAAFTIIDGLASNYVRAILEDNQGTLWFGTSQGVSRYDGQSWTTFTKVQGLADDIVYSIIEDSQGALWFGTFEGVSYFDGENWKNFTTSDGLAKNRVYTIIEDSQGALWFGSDGSGGGVSRLKDDISPKTLIVISPRKLTGNISPLFSYAATDNLVPENRFRFSWTVKKSENAIEERDWSPFSVQTSVNLPPLSNGNYTFSVRSIDFFGNIDPKPPEYSFTLDATPPTVNIISPKSKEVISENVPVIGSAFDTSPIRDFIDYVVEYGVGDEPGEIDIWESISFPQSDTVRNDTLAIWNTSNLRNGLYWLKLSARDSLGHESEDVIQVEVVKSTNQIRQPRDGALLSVDAGQIELFIPPNALAQEEQINIRECETITPLSEAEITFTDFCFEITSEREIAFAKPVTMTINYAELSALNLNEQKLTVYHSPDGQSDWVSLGGSVNTNEKKITTRFTQLGVFALYEDLTVGDKSGISAVEIHPRVFTPNSAGLRSKVDISYNLGQDDQVTCKVYNTAGRLIAIIDENEPKNHGENVTSWNGRDMKGNACPSGLYVVTIQTSAEMKTKTVAVMNH